MSIYSQQIEVHYLGHSAFVLQFDNINVVSDLGKPNAWKDWGWDSPIHNIGELIPDIMTYSHLHEDHYDSTRIPKGVKFILKNGEELKHKDLKITAIPACEDKFGEFNNTSYLFSYKGVNILHTGDIQAMIANINNDSIARYFKNNYPEKIDVLILPIEGKIKYIPQTEKFIQLLQPKTVIPCHHWSQEYLNEFISYLGKCEYDINNTNDSTFVFEKINEKHLQIVILNRSDY
jgi:L-ascorbate metabolism protein UlaG (beta-lactamase superfamily)